MNATADSSTRALGEYFAFLHRRRRLLVGIALPVVLTALMLAFALPRLYTAEAGFEFEPAAIDAGRRDPRNTYLDEYVTKLVASVQGSNVAARLREQLGLYPDLPESEALKRINAGIRVEMSTERILDPDSGRQKDTNSGFTLSFDSPTAEGAQKGATLLAEEFVATSRQSRHDKSLQTAKFLEAEAEQYRQRVAQLEARLADFKQRNVDQLPETAQVNMTTKERLQQDLAQIEQELRTLQQNRVFLQSQLIQANASGPDSETVKQLEEEYRRKAATYDRNHPDMVALRRQIDTQRRLQSSPAAGGSLQTQLNAQQALLDEMRQRYSADHPDVKRQERAIADLRERIARGERGDPAVPLNPVVTQLQTQLAGNDNQTAAVMARREEVRLRLQQLESRIATSPQVEKEYQALTRDLGLARERYDELLKRKMDEEFAAAASLAGSGDEFRLARMPLLPAAPSKPSRAAIVILGVMLAGVLAVGVALLAEALDQTVRGTRDVARLLDASPLAIVPEIRNSVFARRRFRHLVATAASAVIGAPVLYFLIRLFVA